MRLIDADAYLKRIRPRGIADELWTTSETYLSVMRMPPVDAVPVVHGRWEHDGHHIRCDKCGVVMCDKDREGDAIPQNFCPNCGARMDGDDNG